MATELQEVRQVKASPRNTTLPSFGVQNHRQVIPTRWRLNVRNAQPPGGLVSNQVEGHESPQTSYLSHSGEWSRHLERTSVTIPIQGLGNEISGPIDFCIPVTRLHPDSLKFDDGVLPGYTHGPPLIEHISITNTWHGIKWPEAVELFRIHKAFIETLECMLGSELRRIDLQMLQEQCISPLLTSPTMAVVRGISFCREQLVSEMAEALYSSEDVC